jgi:hypothetical protein
MHRHRETLRKMALLLLIAGIIVRFIQQFIVPVFNVDEITLGNDIKHTAFGELLYPFASFQSAPPLFLLLQKAMIEFLPFPFYINIKLLSFIFSVSGLVLFYLLIRQNKFSPVYILLFTILLFNPFIITNSLTVKQYTIDLTGTLFLILNFNKVWFKKYNAVFFLVWTLMSNIGLFGVAAYLMFHFFKNNRFYAPAVILVFLRKNILTIISLIPYLLFFAWFAQQEHFAGMRQYMTHYWSDTFIPLDSGIFKYLLYTLHGIWILLFNAYEVWGITLFVTAISWFFYSKKKEMLFYNEIILLLYMMGVHLTLNIFHMYPFSDRLYLYLSTVFILLLGSSLDNILQRKVTERYSLKIIAFASITTAVLYCFYAPFTDNDVNGLSACLKKDNATDRTYATAKAIQSIESTYDFSDGAFKSDIRFLEPDDSLQAADYIVSRVGRKIKRYVTSPEEDEIADLLAQHKIRKVDAVNGYNIYEIIRK